MKTELLNHHQKVVLNRALDKAHLKLTQQRKHVFAILMAQRDHPTADEVYERVKSVMPSISLATVYNSLEALVDCGLVKQVHVEREPSRYCPNLAEHAHFHCLRDGRVYDIPLPAHLAAALKKVLPEGYEAESVQIAFNGHRAPNAKIFSENDF